MYVHALPHLKSDVLTLLILLETPEPPVHLICSKKNVALYGFGDASGSGYVKQWVTSVVFNSLMASGVRMNKEFFKLQRISKSC
jgi:hypothetical protein